MAVDMSVLVADNEFIRMIRQIVNGIPTNDDTLMIDEIVARGPEAEYISTDSTLRGLKGLSTTRILDRRSREEWEADGSLAMYETARKEARRILAEEKVEPLPDEILQRLDAIVAAADDKYADAAAVSS